MALFLKILCDISKQKKFIDAGPVAAWLWLAGLGHCRLSSTDGFIPRAVVPTLVPGLKAPFTHAATLCRVGLWLEVPDGYSVHHYLDMNPSRAELEEIKKEDADRKRRVREMSERTRDPMSKRTGVPVSGEVGQPDASRGRGPAPAGIPAGTPSPSPSDSPSGFTGLISEESARETAISRPIRPIRGGLIGRHHVTCDPATWTACERGLCVPPFVAAEWRQSAVASGVDADAAIRDMLAAWASALRVGTVLATPKPAEYWRAVWARWNGDAADRVRGRSDSRTGHTVAEGLAYLEDVAAKVKS